MKKTRAVFSLLMILIVSQTLLRAQVSFGKPEKINEQWEFYPGDDPGEKTQWRAINLPHDWSIEGVLNPSLAACTGYLPGGIAWYKKTISIPADKASEKVYIYFEGIQNRSEVYINGKLLGKRPNGYVSFMYDMTPYISFGKENMLTVRVDHSRYADSRWYTGSGIYRNVWLIYSNPVHITQWGVFCYPKTVTGKRADLNIESELENNTGKPVTVSINNQLSDASGKVIATGTSKVTLIPNGKQKITTTLKINNPRLWSLTTPYLYTLKTALSESGKVIDETTMKTGIREFTFDANRGFALNGEWMKMKGVCIHHDAGVLGAAVPREVWERRLVTLKSLGCNAIRMTHNLHNPDVYELCDELGLFVMNEVFDEWEFPKRKWIKGWNVGEPGFQGASDYFDEWSETDLGDGVRRDRNHPSVFAWSIGNEVDYPNDPYTHKVLDGSSISQPMFGGYRPEQPSAGRLSAISKRLVAVVKKYDPSRPVTAGLAGVVMSNQTEYPFVLDITGYNYTENRYDTDHAEFPNRIIYGSENRHDMSAWKAVRDKEHIFGQFLWTGINYLGESGVWPARGSNAGLLDLGGFMKPRGYFRKTLWSDEPFIYLGTYIENPNRRGRPSQPSADAWPVWNYEEGQQVRVVCYTNAKKAQLFLNNEAIGDVKDFDDNTGIIFWDVPYKPGALTVKGYDSNGGVTGEHTLQTSGPPAAIGLKVYKSIIDKNRGVAQIEIQLLDENGNPAILADNQLTCRIEGPGKLLGLEAGDNTDMGNYRDNIQRVYMGRMIAYVEATGEGEIKVSFSSPWLKTATININARNRTPSSFRTNVPLDSIVLSDPAILADHKTNMYYMTGTGGMMWKSKDLRFWDGPYRVTETNPGSWMGPTPMIWAAELHHFKDKYYYFATFTNRSVKIDTVEGNIIERRACQVLVSDKPDGPYVPMQDPIYLPARIPTLDGTFWVDKDGKPYMVYCYEWLQNRNGTIEKIELKSDLSGTIGEGKVLFRASDSPWSREKDKSGNQRPNMVTDGPYLFLTETGRLGMIWTSWIYDVYTQGVVYSESGTLDGPWIHEKEPITPPNFGHGMLFRTLEGKMVMSVHSHKNINGRTHRVPHLFEVDLSGDRLVVGGPYQIK